MLIGNPKVRNKINSIIDSFCVGTFFVLVPIAILVGGIVGFFKKIF